MTAHNRWPFAKLVTQCAILFLTASMTLAPRAQAQFIYSYTGKNFTQTNVIGPTSPPNVFSTNNSVSGFLQLSALLGSNLVVNTRGSTVTPVSFRFTDGLNTFTDANVTSSFFSFSTDALGNITEWVARATLFNGAAGGGYAREFTTFSGTYSSDRGVETVCGPTSTASICAYFGDPFYQVSGSNYDAPGTWQVQTTVPEPSSVLLVGVGLVCCAIRLRRRA